jgi:propanediol dehydratase large subunit
MTAEDINSGGRPVGRVRFMDAQRVNLDGFAVEDAELGLVAMRSPCDPEPGLVIRDGRVTEMDGVTEDRFDSLDAYIARHGIDLTVAEEAMRLPDVEFARRLVSADVPRALGEW